jgi:glycosyltransferase involved in cell wall biosynthesis
VIVLYCADTRFPIERANGVQTFATCHALAERGHLVTLLVRPDSTNPARDPFAFYALPPPETLTIVTAPSVAGPRARRVQFLLTAGARAARHQGIVFTRDLGLASFLLQLPRARRPRVIYESHGPADVVAGELPALLGRPELASSRAKLARLARRERRVWTRASAYVTITRALACELESRFGRRERVFVVPDGAHSVSDVASDPGAAAPAGAHVAGYAGHLYPWKGVDVMLRALALTTEVGGLIVGGHPAEADRARLEALARTLRIEDRVHFTGLIPHREVAAQLRRASCLVLPNTPSAISDRYTSPLKLFEYLWMNRPIIASDLAAIREVLTDGETALLVPAGDAAALAAALDRLASDAGLSERLARAARALAPSFTWARRAERLEAALEAAAG